MLALLIVPARSCQTFAQEQGLEDRLNEAYRVLAMSPEEAVPMFRSIVSAHPSHVLARRQLGILYAQVGKHEDALEQFLAANALLPSDTTQLQIAYLLNSLGRNEEALPYFSGLTTSSDPRIRGEARKSELVLRLMTMGKSYPWWTKLYAAPYYDSRFENTVLWGSFHLGRYLVPSKVLSGYGTLHVTRDTRSSGGQVPVIFSDNYALAGVGVRIEPVRGFIADVQGGVAFDLIERPGRNRTRGDARAVASYGNGVYPPIARPESARMVFNPFVETYTAVGYYTRYENAIGYSQLRVGARVIEWNYSALDLYLRGDVSADSEREFYNNIAEAGIGLRLIPNHLWGMQILAQYHRGTYWHTTNVLIPFDRYYNSFRLYLVMDRAFRL